MSNRWITITTDHLEDAKVAALVTALREQALGDGQTDPSPRIVQDVIDHIRRKIQGNQENVLDADETTIPKGLKTLAVDLILARLKGRLEIALTEDERRQIERHERDLNRIASGDDVIEQADTELPSEVQPTGGTPSITTDRRDTLRTRRSGL